MIQKNIEIPYIAGPIIVAHDGTKVFHLDSEAIKTLHRLPQEVRDEVNENVHKYIEQVGRDHPEK